MSPELPEHATCLQCGYALRGLPRAVCPECGRAFDPADAGTYRLGPRVPRWRRWAQPPNLWEIGAALLLAAFVVVGRTNPIAHTDPVPPLTCCALVPLTPALLLLYGARLVATLADASRARADQQRPLRRTAMFRWAALPVALVVSLSTLPYNWPLMLRFGLSRAALEAEARRLSVQPSGYTIPVERFLGLYYVDYARIDSSSGSVRLCTGTSLLDHVGFLYDPNGRSQTQDIGLPRPWYAYED